MTEYDYSPEAYERYLTTQKRIANWVDKTEDHRPQFADALQPPATHMPGYEQSFQTEGNRRSHGRHRSRSPSPDMLYGRGPHAPGPMPPMHSAPGHLGTFPQHQMPFQHHSPGPSPPASPSHNMPPSYYGTPSPKQLNSHRRSKSQAPRPHFVPPPLVLSPPISPGMYAHPGSPTGYVMMPQQPMPMMSPPAPNSAPADFTSFALPAAATPPQSPGYFQMQPHQAHPLSFSTFMVPPGAAPGVPMYAFSTSSGMVSPPHSAYPEYSGFPTLVSPMHSPYTAMYPQVTIQSPTTAGATSPGFAYVYPSTGLHQRVYEMTGHNKHLLRRSIG
ncbi:hypothetical protein FA15DRAFT_751380 [Coprinopsis marcescibilis]|uniref:Uncharacterized protein n=1 Tax=Coprinopsis marcescibilis TaxID=230819 RepID=A0A5C3LBZ6_COPMA|nr:hypothetical protein FA15DRAFT_751380 [Coprinopsis marcescibilis]